MTVQVLILQDAEADLQELRRDMVRRFDESRWRDSKQEIAFSLARIASHPYAGELPEELVALNLVQYRQMLSSGSRAIYELRGDVAYVHVICNVRRDLCAVLLRRLLERNPSPRATRNPRFDPR